MRRIMALILSVLMIVAIAFPTWTFAETEEENGLENVIKTIKRKFDIPDGCKFDSYDVYENQNREKVWNLSWYNKEKEIRLYVSTTEEGKIVNYNYYEPYKEQEKKFPEVIEEKALEKAEDFIRKISPAGTLSKISKQDAFQNPIFNRHYYFNYYRVVNGIPFYQDNVHISVNTETGKIYSYNHNIDDRLVFPDAENIISVEDAQKAYTEKLGLELIYKYNYDYKDEKVDVFPVYVPKYDNNIYAVDAVTADKIRTGRYGIYGGAGDMAADQALMMEKENVKKAAGVAEEPRLTPEEIEAVKKQAELITGKEAEKIAREIPENNLDEGYVLRSWNLNRSWPIKEDFVYNMSFRKETGNEQGRYLYADVAVNAKTGEVVRFYMGYPYTEEKPKFDADSAKAAAEEYLKNLAPEKFAEVELEEAEEEIDRYPGQEPQRYFNFNYVRKVNDISFPGNGIYVGFDAVNGKVTNFNINWFDIDFPDLDNVISFEEAHEAFFENIGLELQYKQVDQEDDFIPIEKTMPMVNSSEDGTKEDGKKDLPGIKLVYVLKSGKPFILDANTGSVINYDGKPYKEEKPAEYTDIEGHYAEEKIKELVKYRIINFTDSEYRPNEEIIQKDFFSILSKIIDRYYGPIIMEDSGQDEIDEMYKQLLREGVIKKDEIAPESPVTREDAVKFIIRALKYDKVADIPKIFRVSFVDVSEINPRLIGYVAIANGLNIVSGAGGRFKPKDNLTRAEAAVMIYNYLEK
jgi:hypothetical protein